MLEEQIDEIELNEEDELEKLIGKEPIAKLYYIILRNAIINNTSDIYFGLDEEGSMTLRGSLKITY